MTKKLEGNDNVDWVKLKDLKDESGEYYVHCNLRFKDLKELMKHMVKNHPRGRVMITIRGNGN
jgi:phosphoribosyl-dephospho-CoA transferase